MEEIVDILKSIHTDLFCIAFGVNLFLGTISGIFLLRYIFYCIDKKHK